MIVLAVGLAAFAVIATCVPRQASESAATTLTRRLLVAVAVLVTVQLVLGALGWLRPGSTTLALVAVAVAFAYARRHAATIPGPPRTGWTPIDAALAGALAGALVLRLFAGLRKTTFLYDTLSYHLHAPLAWQQASRLEIVPSPFGDPAPAYAPANLELVFAFLMAPLRSDALAGVGQLPFAALAVVAIAAAVRESGGSRAGALGAALAFLLVPEVWTQAPTAMTDLGLAALLVASTPFLVRLARGANTGDAIAAGLSLGLAIGSKYVGVLLALPFAAAAAIALRAREHGWRGRLAFVAPLAVLGGVWYFRNLVVTGNPFYPVATLGFAGLYDRTAMRGWDYHVPIADIGALGEMLLAAGVGFVSAAGVALARNWREPETALAVALVALFWLVVPYQESRFLFPALAVAAIAIGRQADRPPAMVGWGALTVAIVASLIAWPTPARLALVPAALAGVIALLAWRRATTVARILATGAAAVALTVALAIGIARYAARDPGYAVGDDIDAAWRWFRANVRDRRVAYTGTNLAFPLAGERLSNRVRYVNVAGTPDDRLHDFGRRAPGLRDSAEPAPYRDGADFATWRSNLRATGTEVLFVAAMYPIVRRAVAADTDGFPIERAWADAHPAEFHLRFASNAARVYGVAP